MIDNGGRGKRPGKDNIWLSLILMCGASALIGTGGYYGYRYYCESVNDGFLKGTCVDGEDVYGMTTGEAWNMILNKYSDSEIVITEGENVDLEGNLPYYGYEIDREELQGKLETAYTSQKSDKLSVLKSVFDKYELEIDIKPQENTELFEQRVTAANLGVARYPSKDAYLYYDEASDSCAVKEEVMGNEIDDKVLQDYVRKCIRQTIGLEQPEPADEVPGTGQTAESREVSTAGQTMSSENASEVEPDEGAAGQTQEAQARSAEQPEPTGEGLHRSFEFPWDLCVKPNVYADSPELVSKRDAINEYAGAKLTYVFGEEKREYDLLELADLFMDIEGGKAELNDEKIENFAEKLSDEYSTRYYERTFESTLAGEITIPAKYNDYGYTLLVEDEVEQIREDIESRSHVEREPVYLEKNSWGNPYYLRRNGYDDMDGTYIEVDLTAQHVWYYRDGEVYVDCDCVSGDVTKDHGTKTGCFPLAYKESPSVLTGGEGDDEYEEKVEYWMPFYEGQGLHDASWRYYFGGSIYRGNGSHGCVNLPTWAAAEIYNAVETGTAIVIFYE